MAKDPVAVTQDEFSEPTVVLDAIDKTAGPQFVLDQMADTLERARIAAQGRTDDLSIRWGHEPGDEDKDVRRFWVSRDGVETQHDLSVDGAKLVLDQIGDA